MGKSSGSLSKTSDNKADKKKLLRRSVQLTDKENDFRVKLYPDVSKIKKENLKCTICLRNIVRAIFVKGRLFRHVVLDVLVCEGCLNFYGDGNFSADEDGDDKYCRWCGQGGTLYCCSKCTCAFCKKCVQQNLKRSEVDKLEREDWDCFICRPEPLFPLRAECWAVQERLQNENSKKVKETSRREPSKRKHSSNSEDVPRHTKKEDQGPAEKRSRVRVIEISDDSNSSDKQKLRKHKCQEDSESSDCTDKSCAKSEKAENPRACINRSKSPKRKTSPVHIKRLTNHDSTEGHVSSKKSTVSVNSDNNSSESKMFKDVKAKVVDKHVDLVNSSNDSKSKLSMRSLHLRDSSLVCSESKKNKKQIKLARNFVLSTKQNVKELGKVMMKRVKMYKQIITPNSLETLDDVFKTINKLSKMLICFNKNVSIIQETLEQDMKNWTAVMDVLNTENLNSLSFNKSEVKNEDEIMVTDELVKGNVASASENVKDTVNKDDAMRADKSENPEFSSGVDFEQVIDDLIQTVTKNTENEA